MNIQQNPDEEIRAFSVRVRIAARKVGTTDHGFDIMCVSCLKRGCAPYLTSYWTTVYHIHLMMK